MSEDNSINRPKTETLNEKTNRDIKFCEDLIVGILSGKVTPKQANNDLRILEKRQKEREEALKNSWKNGGHA